MLSNLTLNIGPLEGLTMYLVALLVAAAPLLLLVAVWQRYFLELSKVDGPFWASFGSFWQCWHAWKGDYPLVLLDLHKKYGAFVRVRYDLVSISHADGLRVLTSSLDKPRFYDMFAIPSDKYPNALSIRSYEETLRMRQNIAQGFSMSNILKSESHVDEAIVLLEQCLSQDAGLDRSKPTPTKSIDLGKWLHFLTNDTSAKLIFSADVGYLASGTDVANSIWNSNRLSGYISFFSCAVWLHYLFLGSPLFKYIDPAKLPYSHLWNLAVARIDDRKKDTEARADMMEHWLARQRERPDRMSEKDLLATATLTFAAGGETVGAVLDGFFYSVLKGDPKIVERLQRELSGAGHLPGDHTPISYADALNLPFLQACLRETFRLCSPVPWTLPRIAPKQGFTAAGHHFPAGTIISVSPYVLHRNTDIWGPDAEEFRPDRWLVDAQAAKDMEKYLIHFGAGYNRCLGNNVAKMELGKMAATLVRDFEFELEFPKRDWEVSYGFALVQKGWPVFVRKRKV